MRESMMNGALGKRSLLRKTASLLYGMSYLPVVMVRGVLVLEH